MSHYHVFLTIRDMDFMRGGVGPVHMYMEAKRPSHVPFFKAFSFCLRQ